MQTLTKPADSPAKLLDVQAVAELLGCSTRHVYRLSDAGRLPAPVRLGTLVPVAKGGNRRMDCRRLPLLPFGEGGAAMKREALREQSESAKLAGMEIAAGAKLDKVTSAKIALLRALLRSPDGTATIDDATSDLAAEFSDGGKWRGTVTRSLAIAGLIRRVDVVPSDRPSRHRGYVTRWLLVNRRRAQVLLSRLVAAMDCRIHSAAEAVVPSKSETPAGATAGVSSQLSFPTF